MHNLEEDLHEVERKSVCDALAHPPAQHVVDMQVIIDREIRPNLRVVISSYRAFCGRDRGRTEVRTLCGSYPLPGDIPRDPIHCMLPDSVRQAWSR